MAMKSLKLHTRHGGCKEEGRTGETLSESREVSARRSRSAFDRRARGSSPFLATPTPLTAVKSLDALTLPGETSRRKLRRFLRPRAKHGKGTTLIDFARDFAVSYQLAVRGSLLLLAFP